MALGRRKKNVQQELMVPTSALPRSPGHPFYAALNKLLAEAKFDQYVEDLCAPLYAEGGRPSLPPGVFFRMLFVGYFEGIDSQRGIAWRCSDSMSLRTFLGLAPTDASPDHSTLTLTRQRLPKELIEQVFSFVLKLAFEKKQLKGRAIGIDATTLEANAAMKSIVRRDGGASWKAYLMQLAKESGIENPTDDQLRQFDRTRKGKKTSNDDWQSPSDPDARITKMKDGTTALGYKAEHAVDLDTEIVVAADVKPADAADGETAKETVVDAQGNLNDATKQECRITEVVADKGYHKAETLAWLDERDIRSYVPPRSDKRKRRWDDKPDGWREAVYENRRRVARDKGKQLQRRRAEVVERSFAHVCTTGGARRTWIRGLVEVSKRYLVTVMAHNLGVIMRVLIGVGKPRELASMRTLFASLHRLCSTIFPFIVATLRLLAAHVGNPGRGSLPQQLPFTLPPGAASSTGC
jgi:transposase